METIRENRDNYSSGDLPHVAAESNFRISYRQKESSHQTPGLICLFGFFLHIVLADGVLNTLGFHYSTFDGNFYEKIHPGTYFIIASFFVLIADQNNPVAGYMRTFWRYPVFSALLLIDICMFIFVNIRSGPGGTAFMIDTHMTVPICAIVLSAAPRDHFRKAIYFFVAVAAINSMIGIVEAAGQFRVFAYDQDMPGMKEEYFRASAFRGHPLNNAMFASIGLFVAMALPYRKFVKLFLITVFLVSLVAFGGRAGLMFSVFGVMILGAVQLVKIFLQGRMTMTQLFLLIAGVVTAPIALAMGLYYLIMHSDVGARLAASSFTDESAGSRLLVVMAFDYMKTPEFFFGMSSKRVIDVAYRMNLDVPLADIENPWLLMFMYFGGIFFVIWFFATMACIFQLLRGKPLALQLAVLSYFAVASTSNSFGRKDSTYLIMVCAVICAARALTLMQEQEKTPPIPEPAALRRS